MHAQNILKKIHVDLANGSFGSGSGRVKFKLDNVWVIQILFGFGFGLG